MPRHALHAHTLGFIHPTTKRNYILRAQCPKIWRMPKKKMEKLFRKLKYIENFFIFVELKSRFVMRKLYAIVCLALLSNAYKAQESLPYYQQYLLDGEFLFNPAQYGKTDYVQLNANYQQQFSKFSEFSECSVNRD